MSSYKERCAVNPALKVSFPSNIKIVSSCLANHSAMVIAVVLKLSPVDAKDNCYSSFNIY